MLRIRLSQKLKKEYRDYSPTKLNNAYMSVMQNNTPVYRAARQYGVPLTTLRDRVDGRVSLDTVHSGPSPLFSLEQEVKLVNHVKFLAEVGYGYTRSEVLYLANDYAVHLKLRDESKPLSAKWMRGFYSRWPEMHSIKPASLSVQRARCTTPACISKYFSELEHILKKYDLVDKPWAIYNVDEKGLNTEHKPPKIVAGRDLKNVQAVTSDRSPTITVLGCGNAAGTSIPPYFVFPGKRMMPDLLEGRSPGSDGCVSDSGWSNMNIFENYVKFHFLKFVQGRDSSQPILLLYDGHTSHVSLHLIEWAKSENIILFVLPPHTSHILQPMDVGCFGPFETVYNKECHSFVKKNGGQVVTRYDVCQLACKAYNQALSHNNLVSAFRKSGVWPINAEVVTEKDTAPSLAYQGKLQNAAQPPETGEHVPVSTDERDEASQFLAQRGGDILKNVKTAKVRRNISKIIGGKAITENAVFNDIKKFKDESEKKKSKKRNVSEISGNSKPKDKENGKAKKRQNTVEGKRIQNTTEDQGQPGTSGVARKKSKTQISESTTSSSSDDEIDESEKCCQCGKFQPEELKHCISIIFTKWAQCDNPDCGHWTHLGFCTPVRVIRRDTNFFCPHCTGTSTEE